MMIFVYVIAATGGLIILIALAILAKFCCFGEDKPKIDPNIDFVYNKPRKSTVP